MKLATFNVNGIRARLPIVLDWLAENQPDVLAIQETKCENAAFPLEELQDHGWNVVAHGQKSYNGVALVAREPILSVEAGFGDPLWPDDCRLLCAQIGPVKIVNTYVPNGTKVGTAKFEYKLAWMERLGKWIAERFRPHEPVVWLGDVNVAPTEDDVFDPKRHMGSVGFHPEELERLKRLTEWGWVDAFRRFTVGPGHYTFWEMYIPRSFERNLGWRIDHIYVPEGLASRCASCVIDKAPRALERPSDHTPVVLELSV